MARVYKFIIFCTLLPCIVSQCTVQNALHTFRRSVYDFSTGLLRRIAEEKDGHFISSTLSPHATLSVLSLGAEHDTLLEIRRNLYLHRHKCFNSNYLWLANRALTSENATFERSSTIFVDESVKLNQAFVTRISAIAVCDLKRFSSPALQINSFVKNYTHGNIESIFKENGRPDLIMADALYFKGLWRTGFPVEDTERSTFYDANGNPSGEVNLMYLKDTFNMTSLDHIEASVLELPYEKYSMLVFLPNQGVNATTMIERLNRTSIAAVFSSFKRKGSRKVSVSLPRFKITTGLSLKELLLDMGLMQMFDATLARFSLLSDENVYVSSFVQKAVIEVTEAGRLVADADEDLILRCGSSDLEFIANRPFVFMVVDRDIEVPVFAGIYSKPTLY